MFKFAAKKIELEDITSRVPLSLDDLLTRIQEAASEPFRAAKETRSNTIKSIIFFPLKLMHSVVIT